MFTGGPFAPFASPPQTVVPVTRKAKLIRRVTLKSRFREPFVIGRGTEVEAGTSFFPRRKRTWHTQVTLPCGTLAIVPTKSLRFEGE